MYNVKNTSFTHYPGPLRSDCASYNALDSAPSLHLLDLFKIPLLQLLLLANYGNGIAISGKKGDIPKVIIWNKTLKINLKIMNSQFAIFTLSLLLCKWNKPLINFPTSAILDVFLAFDSFNMIRPDCTQLFHPIFITCFDKEYT